MTILTNGECAITAHQDGNANYYAAPDVTRSFTIGMRNQTITWTEPLPDRVYGDPNFYVLTATASSGLPVTFASTSAACSVGYVNGVGYTVTITAAGTCEITASQAGNADFYPAPDVIRSFYVAKADQTITFDAVPAKTYGDPPFVYHATASSGLPVYYPDFNTPVCDNMAVSEHNVITIKLAGDCILWAAAPGDDNYNPVTLATQKITIARADQYLTWDEPLPTRWLGDAPFTVSATASSGLPVTFNVVSYPDYPATCSVSGNTVTIFGSGICAIRANQDGASKYKSVYLQRYFAVGRYIDLTIWIYWNPSAAYRTAYQNILGYFADAIYEMSNGTQKVRNVTFNNTYYPYWINNPADVIWTYQQWPCANVGGYNHGNPIGGHVYMGDVFPFNTPYPALNSGNQRGAGYALAHEWGHYYYGLFDEYAANGNYNDPGSPHSSDVPVTNSIMNNQWQALTGDYHWLNFSVPKYTLNGYGRTAQDREYAISGWQTVKRATSQDPRTPHLWANLTRTYFPEFYPFYVTSDGEATLELPTTPNSVTRSELAFHWNTTSSVSNLSQQDTPGYGASVFSLTGNEIQSPSPVVLVANARLESTMDSAIAGASLQVEVEGPDGLTASLPLRDDGIAPDALANDGKYSGLLDYNQNGVYTVTVTFTNPTGDAYLTAISAAHAIGPNGETWTPTMTPVTDAFTVTASAQITITNYQADDHGDTAQTATVLLPDDIDMPGRIDRGGDVDMFQVTPDNSEMLVLRLSGMALNISPRIRVLDQDGMTVLYTFDVLPLGDNYFFTRLQVQAGVPFYVEVSDQNVSASRGLYVLSVGQPLNIFKERITATIFLPVVSR